MFPDPEEEPVYDCLDCDKPIEQRPVIIGGQKCYQRYCDPCTETDLVVKMYQDDGLTPEAISIDLDIPLQDVLAITDECDIASKDCDQEWD